MNTKKWEAFIKCVELGSLSRAAEDLGYTQSGISHMMQSLEQEVGFPLLARTAAGIQPNGEGEILLPAVRQLLSANESLEQYIASIRGADTGRIRIAAYPSVATYWLPAILREYQRDFPHVEIQITETGSATIETRMANRQAELCIYAGGDGKDFEWIPLKRSPAGTPARRTGSHSAGIPDGTGVYYAHAGLRRGSPLSAGPAAPLAERALLRLQRLRHYESGDGGIRGIGSAGTAA